MYKKGQYHIKVVELRSSKENQKKRSGELPKEIIAFSVVCSVFVRSLEEVQRSAVVLASREQRRKETQKAEVLLCFPGGDSSRGRKLGPREV